MLSVVVMLLCCFRSLSDLIFFWFSYRCRGVTAHNFSYVKAISRDLLAESGHVGKPLFQYLLTREMTTFSTLRQSGSSGLSGSFTGFSLVLFQTAVWHIYCTNHDPWLWICTQTSGDWKTGSEEIKSWLGSRRQVGSNSMKRRTDGLQVRLDLWPSPSWTKRMPALTRCSAQTPGEICQIRGSKSTSRFAGPQFQTQNVVKNVCRITIL